MPKPTKGARLGGSASHQKAILANLATSLFEHGRITTTEAKAKRLRPYAEEAHHPREGRHACRPSGAEVHPRQGHRARPVRGDRPVVR